MVGSKRLTVDHSPKTDSLNWETYGWPKSANRELKINVNGCGWAGKIFCGKTFQATMDNYLKVKSYTKQICRRNAANLPEAKTLQGQITQFSSIADKRSNLCHTPSRAVEIIVNKTRKDELGRYKQIKSSHLAKPWHRNQDRVISISPIYKQDMRGTV